MNLVLELNLIAVNRVSAKHWYEGIILCPSHKVSTTHREAAGLSKFLLLFGMYELIMDLIWDLAVGKQRLIVFKV